MSSLQLSPQQAAAELLARRRARAGLESYIQYLDTGFAPARHHRLLIEKLEAVERGEIKRLMVFMPPGSAKSTYGSVLFPSWYLGRNRKKSVIAASHNGELAERFGRKVRNYVGGTEFHAVFSLGLADDSKAAARWETTEGGEYFAVGVGGSVTGRRADLGIIDDPVKSREEADSETIREKVWEWYKADFYTRLKPGAGIVLIQCMVGETRVLMADGSEKMLKDIRAGNAIATYEAGGLSTSTVVNWAKQGSDRVYAIRTSSGIIVKANERHPFLVERDGSQAWIRVRELKIGDKLQRASIGESGAGLPALTMDATSPRRAKATAPHITTRPDGLTATDRHLSTPNPDAQPICATGTESTLTSTGRCLPSKTDAAPSAERCQERTCEHTGAENCASITTTRQAECVGCCATTAISRSDTERLRTCFFGLLSIYEIAPDAIVEITEAGREDVYDIQVEGTENFIANGVVSHNTRWHEDDLAGKLLKDAKEGGEQWEIVSLPMEAEELDPLGREVGELLWPEWFTPEMIAQAKRDPRNWLALYQQRPRPDGGGVFKREWVMYYEGTPDDVSGSTNRYLLVDAANGKRPTNDYTSMWVVGLGQDSNYYVLDMIRDRLNLPERAAAVMRLHRKWKPKEVRYEKYGMMADVQHLKTVQSRENYRFDIIEVAGQTPKADRIKRLVPLFEAKSVWFPLSLHKTDHTNSLRDLVSDFTEQEFLAFPVSSHDDMLDALARIAEPDLALTWPKQADLNDDKPTRYSRESRQSAWAQ